MTVNYTTSLALGLPVTGTESGTWGDDVNNAITSYLDIAVAGTLTISTDADVTLSQTQGTSSATNISSSTAQYMQLLCSGARTALRNISVPNVSKMYVVNNATTGGFGVKIRGVTGPTTGITVVAGEKALVMWDGSDFVKISSSLGTGDVVGPASATDSALAAFDGTTGKLIKQAATVTVAQGGTGSTTLTANNVLLGNGTSALQVVAPGTNGNVLTSNGTTWQSTTPAAGVSLSADNTWTGTQTFSGTSAKFGVVLNDAAEVTTVSATAATGTINYDITTQSVLYYTTNASANWTVNFRASSGTSLNTALATGQSATVAFLVTQGSTAYYNNVVQVDGTTSGVTMRWLGGAPAAGNASGIDSYRYLIIKTGSATYTVLASVTQFKA